MAAQVWRVSVEASLRQGFGDLVHVGAATRRAVDQYSAAPGGSGIGRIGTVCQRGLIPRRKKCRLGQVDAIALEHRVADRRQRRWGTGAAKCDHTNQAQGGGNEKPAENNTQTQHESLSPAKQMKHKRLRRGVLLTYVTHTLSSSRSTSLL